MDRFQRNVLTSTTLVLALLGPAAYADPHLSAPFVNLPRANTALDAESALAMIRASSSSGSFSAGDVFHQLKLYQQVSSQALQTVKFQHYYMGLEVVGSMAMVQTGKLGRKVLNRVADFDLDTQPGISQDQAIQIALSVSGGSAVSASGLQLKILPDGQGNTARLIYVMDVDKYGQADRQVTIDAHSGKVIGNTSKLESIAPIEIFNAANTGVEITAHGGKTKKSLDKITGCTATDLSNGSVLQELTATECKNLDKQTNLIQQANCQLLMNGEPEIVDTTSCNVAIDQTSSAKSLGQAAADDSANRAEQNSEAVLNYYMNHFQRDSYDGKGAPLVSIVHGGVQFDNAFWNTGTNIMLYGDGDGKMMGDFTQGVDVAGHEMTHGVTSQTAKLSMMGESGALNEANSDFFGIMIANGGSNWVLGQQLFLSPTSSTGQENAVRDLANPGNIEFCAANDGTQCTDRRKDPTTMSEVMPTDETCDEDNDNCWVHINATILGHASYLVAQAIGADQTEKLYYATLTQSLTASSTIQSAADSYKQTCGQMFDANTCTQVTQAFAQVGL